jgi:hypothetical protein
MMVNDAPSMIVVRPMTPRSPPNRRTHRPWLNTTDAERPAVLSSGVKLRPSAVVTPSVEKRFAETPAASMRSASPSPLIPMLIDV